jgi:hypothetical protein
LSEFEEEMKAVAEVAMRRLGETEDPEEQAMLWQLLEYAARLERKLQAVRMVTG